MPGTSRFVNKYLWMEFVNGQRVSELERDVCIIEGRNAPGVCQGIFLF